MQEFAPLEPGPDGSVFLGDLVRWGFELLRTLPETTRVVLSSDPEGNTFRTLYEGAVSYCVEQAPWDIEIPHPDDIDPDDPPTECVVVFWPG